MDESFKDILNVAVNYGMSIIITVYFLYRDWKYQGTLTSLLGTLSAAIDRFNSAVDRMGDEK